MFHYSKDDNNYLYNFKLKYTFSSQPSKIQGKYDDHSYETRYISVMFKYRCFKIRLVIGVQMYTLIAHKQYEFCNIKGLNHLTYFKLIIRS